MRPLNHPVSGHRLEPPLTRPVPPPRDPAPSRIAYRLHRLWLTPLVRILLRRVLPVAALVAGLLAFVATPENITRAHEGLTELRRSIEQRPEFMVVALRIEDASPELAEDIRELTSLTFPVSSFDLDLPHLRAEIEGLDAVGRADLVIRSGGILEIRIDERVPVAIWRHREAVELVDVEGRRVQGLSETGGLPPLPLIVGDGADRAVAEALALIDVAARWEDRIAGLVRMGERRWDLVLASGQRILLPEREAVAALEYVIALDGAHDLLNRDFKAIDLRNSARPTLRLSPEALEKLHLMRGPGRGDDS
ncbi:MAG: cell division protein FtsQ/DivIB [Rhodobacteraceae bacterium]|nr:cell division protein FtsQ/DivIB [Paracoccaceae bacterium]